jgi:CRP-like cAMP-binding protein
MISTLVQPPTAPTIPLLPQQRGAGTARRPLLHRLGGRLLDPKVALLATLELFAGVPERDLVGVATLVEHLDLPAGERLLTERTVAAEAFVLVRGVAQATLKGRVLGQAAAGELLGDLALLRSGFSPVTWDAVTDVSVLSVTPRELHEVMRRCPVVADRLHGLTS